MKKISLALFSCMLGLLLGSHSVLAQRIDQMPPKMQRAAPSPPALEAPPRMGQGIAAVVNDDVITTSDIENRMALAILSSNLPSTPEVRARLFPQILNSLIDEQLQLQEGKRLSITVTQAEIDQALAKLSQDNAIPGGDIKAFLTAKGVSPVTLINQARAALTWTKVAQRSLRTRVEVGDDEVDAVIDRMRLNAGKQEYLTSEIYLAINSPSDEDKVRAFAENLIKQIKSGTPFGAVARQFSQGSSAANGGDIGWIQAGQLSAELDRVLQKLEPGTISTPIRSANGFYVLGVRDKRTNTMGEGSVMAANLRQVFRPFANANDKQMALSEAEKIRTEIISCSDLSRMGKDFPQWRQQDLGRVDLAKAPAWLIDKINPVEVGHATEAMATEKGALIIFVCDREMKETVNRDAIMNGIGQERMELLARRLLRDLRKNAFLDIRVSSL